MKKVYEFEVLREENVEVKEDKIEKGEAITITKTVKKEVPVKFFIKTPGRSLQNEASLYYSSEVSKALRKGLMSVTMLNKRYSDDGGIYSKDEKARIDKLQKTLETLIKEKDEISKKKKNTSAEKKRLEAIDKELDDTTPELIDFNQAQIELYKTTAEYYAQEQTMMYWVCFLSCNEDETPFFGEESFDKRVAKYDEIQDLEDKFYKDVAFKFVLLTSFWSRNQDAAKEEYDEILRLSSGSA
jgi:hypothetical protein